MCYIFVTYSWIGSPWARRKRVTSVMLKTVLGLTCGIVFPLKKVGYIRKNGLYLYHAVMGRRTLPGEIFVRTRIDIEYSLPWEGLAGLQPN